MPDINREMYSIERPEILLEAILSQTVG